MSAHGLIVVKEITHTHRRVQAVKFMFGDLIGNMIMGLEVFVTLLYTKLERTCLFIKLKCVQFMKVLAQPSPLARFTVNSLK